MTVEQALKHALSNIFCRITANGKRVEAVKTADLRLFQRAPLQCIGAGIIVIFEIRQ